MCFEADRADSASCGEGDKNRGGGVDLRRSRTFPRLGTTSFGTAVVVVILGECLVGEKERGGILGRFC